MKRGFVQSPFLIHHPQQFRARPPTDRLPPTYAPNPKSTIRKLDDVLADTLCTLEGSPGTATDANGGEELSPVIKDTSMDSSMAMTPVGDSVELPSSPEIPSSPDTVDAKTPAGDEPAEPPRVLELEPWVWANTLISDLQDVVRSKDITDVSDDLSSWPSVSGEQIVKRSVAGEEYMATLITTANQTCESSPMALGRKRFVWKLMNQWLSSRPGALASWPALHWTIGQFWPFHSLMMSN